MLAPFDHARGSRAVPLPPVEDLGRGGRPSDDRARPDYVVLGETRTGSTTRVEAERFPYRPAQIVESIADLVPALD